MKLPTAYVVVNEKGEYFYEGTDTWKSLPIQCLLTWEDALRLAYELTKEGVTIRAIILEDGGVVTAYPKA